MNGNQAAAEEKMQGTLPTPPSAVGLRAPLAAGGLRHEDVGAQRGLGGQGASV